MLYTFHAIWEFVQSRDCIAHSQNPEIAHYSCVTLRLCKLCNLRMHTIVDIQSPPPPTHTCTVSGNITSSHSRSWWTTAEQWDERQQDNGKRTWFVGQHLSNLPYSSKLLREKTFANFVVLCQCAKVFSMKFGGVVFFGTAKASNPQKFSRRKSIFHQSVKVFSLESFPLYGTWLADL